MVMLVQIVTNEVRRLKIFRFWDLNNESLNILHKIICFKTPLKIFSAGEYLITPIPSTLLKNEDESRYDKLFKSQMLI